MRSKPTQNRYGRALALIVISGILGILGIACRHSKPANDGVCLNVRLTAVDSPGEIEQIIKSSLAEKYSEADIVEGYKMYQITNGSSQWLFVQAANAPRGLAMINLFCYEQENLSNWLLRAYVPINDYYYTNSGERQVSLKVDGEYIEAWYRGEVVFTSKSKKQPAK